MKRQLSLLNLILIIFVLMMTNSCDQSKSSQLKAPVAKKIKKELIIHDDIRIDNYFWLNDRENQDVIAYLEAENEYTRAVLKHTEAFQDKIFDEMVSRIKQTDQSVPYRLNGYYYYTRYEEGKEYPIYCRKKGNLDEKEEIMLNVNEMAEGYSFYHIGGWDVSLDNKLIAYSVDTLSRRKYIIHIKNLETGEIYMDRIKNTSGGVTWANDNKTLFYVTKDKSLRPYKIFSHVLSSDLKDRLVYHEKDATYSSGIYKSKSQKYLMIMSRSTLSTEYRILDADLPDGEFKVFHPREDDLLYSVEHFDDKFYIRTNYEAKNFRLMEAPVGKTGKENWIEVIPHRKDVLLKGFDVFDKHLVLGEKIKGLDQLRIINPGNKEDYYVPFEEQTYSIDFSRNYEIDSDLFRFEYSSLTTPNSVFDINMFSQEKTLLKQDEVMGDFTPDDYISERLYATDPDGLQIPISIVYRKDLEKNGKNPLWIQGYGSYGYSSDPYFSSVRLSLMDRGFIVAIAHVRGGQELGRQWYEDGKLLKKKNSFTDFIACTEHLIDQNYTNPEYCFAWGGSAGGLLMGAIMNMRPDLYKGIIAAVPFVDVITTMLDESIPLTTGEFDEWGNPNEKEYYDYMLSYSPYDNVEAKAYPALLVTTGLHDSQVQYWEPAKWVAKLRDLKTDQNQLLLLTQMDFGHGGASGRFERYKEKALEYAFVFDLIGISE
ncbi:MAG: S9 family peptidase [Bacteroidales bacterium]|nr:S9 family peptidase [Bacteroidales bacterium]